MFLFFRHATSSDSFNPESRPDFSLKSRIPRFKQENSRIPKDLLNTIWVGILPVGKRDSAKSRPGMRYGKENGVCNRDDNGRKKKMNLECGIRCLFPEAVTTMLSFPSWNSESMEISSFGFCFCFSFHRRRSSLLYSVPTTNVSGAKSETTEKGTHRIWRKRNLGKLLSREWCGLYVTS